MGIDITGFSKARRVVGRHSDEVCDDDAHYPVGGARKLLDGMKSNCCYVCGGRSYYFGISYGSFDTWQNALSLVIHGVSASEVLDHPRRFKGQPFVEIIAFPESNNVGIGPKTSAKLYEEFVQYATKAKKGFQQLASEATALRSKGSERRAKPRSHTAKLAASLAKAIGGMAVGSDNDPYSSGWEWKWEVYRDFRRAFKLASNDGLVLVSI